jgi:3-(3-hydroxy-phenyl)propionate hydroxylase
MDGTEGRGADGHEVVVAGGGPTGLMLAAELALADVDVVVVERRLDQHVDGSRAGGLLPRTIEVLDQRGVVDRFLDAGAVGPALAYGGMVLDLGDMASRHGYVLALWQSRFEPILADWVDELGVPVLRGREVVGFAEEEGGVAVDVSDGSSLRAGYLVGCDGGRSLVRKAAGIDFAGWDATTSWIVAEVELGEEPPAGMRHDDIGSHGIGPLDDAGTFRVVLTERRLGHGDPGPDELRDALVAVYGTDLGLRRARWTSRFTDLARQAATYRRGRVLVAGDAAHVHSPHGGQGLNTGVQDAVNLGWKLAQVVHGTSDEGLLDTYHEERHPVGARVLRTTMAQVALADGGERHQALRETMTELLAMDEPRRRLAGRLSGLDIRYDLGDAHPLVGRRMPDLDLATAGGATRVSTLLHDARPLLLDLVGDGGFDLSPWHDRVRAVAARHVGALELPVVGEVDRPASVLVRPDGHVAWAGELTDPELAGALGRWCGSPHW